jgi:hypothetical protein
MRLAAVVAILAIMLALCVGAIAHELLAGVGHALAQ